MRILITNDDGYQAKGIKVLADIMKEFGEVTVIAPKTHQSGMSMAVSLGFKQIAHKDLGKGWHYVDATPASCVKFGLNTMFLDNYPDVVVSGINHGSNASTASCYSGTLGAAEEAALKEAELQRLKEEALLRNEAAARQMGQAVDMGGWDSMDFNEDLLNLRNERGMELKNKIRGFTEENPEIVAQLLKRWLNGEEQDG